MAQNQRKVTVLLHFCVATRISTWGASTVGGRFPGDNPATRTTFPPRIQHPCCPPTFSAAPSGRHGDHVITLGPLSGLFLCPLLPSYLGLPHRPHPEPPGAYAHPDPPCFASVSGYQKHIRECNSSPGKGQTLFFSGYLDGIVVHLRAKYFINRTSIARVMAVELPKCPKNSRFRPKSAEGLAVSQPISHPTGHESWSR